MYLKPDASSQKDPSTFFLKAGDQDQERASNDPHRSPAPPPREPACPPTRRKRLDKI